MNDVVLRHITDGRHEERPVSVQVDAVEAYAAFTCGRTPRQCLQQGRLSRSAATDDADQLARRNRERNALQDVCSLAYCHRQIARHDTDAGVRNALLFSPRSGRTPRGHWTAKRVNVHLLVKPSDALSDNQSTPLQKMGQIREV